MWNLVIKNGAEVKKHDGVVISREKLDAAAGIARWATEGLVARQVTGEPLGGVVETTLEFTDEGIVSVSGLGGVVSEYVAGNHFSITGNVIWEIAASKPVI